MTATPLVGSTFFGLDISQLSNQLLSLRRRLSKRVLLLEFTAEQLQLSEASLVEGGVQLNHLRSVPLPPEALDRGVPAEPVKMAGLIQELCAEKNIPAHRVAVVLPPEVAFQRLVDLPAELTPDQARDFVLDPANGLQIPFPLAQTDFDLFPVTTPSIAQRAAGMRLYMLSAIPQVLVDRVIEMLQAADLELQLLELGSLSQLRSLVPELVMLRPQQVELVLELLPDCSHLMFVTCSGLLGSERLAAIRDFPEPELDEQQTVAALQAGLSAESFTLQDENYLPISDLDVRVLIADLKQALARFNEMFPGAEIRCLQLTGINSAHPLLADLLQQALGLPVLAHRPLLATGVAGFSFDQVLAQTSLGRLVGLGLGLLPKDQLVADSRDGADEGDASRNGPGVAIEDLLDLQDQSPRPEQQPLVNVAEGGVIDLIREGENAVLPQQPLDKEKEEATRVLDLLDESEAWPSIQAGLVDVVGEVADQKPLQAEKEEEWPSIGGEVSGSEVEFGGGEVVGGLEEEWPSIGGEVSGSEVEFGGGEVVGGLEEEWPSIGGEVSGSEVELGTGEVLGDLEEKWPSIGGGVSGGDVGLGETIGEADAVVEEKEDEGDLLVIPGLEVTPDLEDATHPVLAQASPDQTEDVGESSSLGELRFADPD